MNEYPLVFLGFYLYKVFEYYKSEKRKDGLEVDNLKFHHWQKDNLEVELTRGTSIVNFYYIDTNKNGGNFI